MVYLHDHSAIEIGKTCNLVGLLVLPMHPNDKAGLIHYFGDEEDDYVRTTHWLLGKFRYHTYSYEIFAYPVAADRSSPWDEPFCRECFDPQTCHDTWNEMVLMLSQGQYISSLFSPNL